MSEDHREVQDAMARLKAEHPGEFISYREQRYLDSNISEIEITVWLHVGAYVFEGSSLFEALAACAEKGSVVDV